MVKPRHHASYKSPAQLDREIELARQRKAYVSAAAAAASRVFAGQPSLSDELLKRAESDAFSAVLVHRGPVFGAGSPELTQKLIMMAREGVKLARSQWATRSHATVRAGSLHSTQTRSHSTKKPKKQLKIYNVDASIIAGNSGEAVWEGSFELPAVSKKEAGQRALDILHDSPYYDDRIDPRADFQVWFNYSMDDMTAEDIAEETRAFIKSAREKVGAST